MPDELGYVPLGGSASENLFSFVSQCYERTSVLVTTNLPFSEWPQVFGDERLTGALLDRLTHRVHVIEMDGDSYRLRGRRNVRWSSSGAEAILRLRSLRSSDGDWRRYWSSYPSFEQTRHYSRTLKFLSARAA